MTKFVTTILLIASMLFVMSCSLVGNEGDSSDGDSNDFTAPDVGTADELSDSGATEYPSTKETSIQLLTEVDDSLTQAINANATVNSPTTSRGTETTEQTIEWQEDYSGGSVNISGTQQIIEKYPDTFAPEPNTTYDDITSVSVASDISGTFTEIVLTSNTNTYTVSGQIDSVGNFSFNFDAVTGPDIQTDDTDVDIYADYSFSAQHGFAVSVKRDDGLGAKYIITYAKRTSGNNISIPSFEDMTPLTDAIMTSLDSVIVNVDVYNDNNELIGDYSVPLSDFYSEADLGF